MRPTHMFTPASLGEFDSLGPWSVETLEDRPHLASYFVGWMLGDTWIAVLSVRMSLGSSVFLMGVPARGVGLSAASATPTSFGTLAAVALASRRGRRRIFFVAVGDPNVEEEPMFSIELASIPGGTWTPVALISEEGLGLLQTAAMRQYVEDVFGSGEGPDAEDVFDNAEGLDVWMAAEVAAAARPGRVEEVLHAAVERGIGDVAGDEQEPFVRVHPLGRLEILDSRALPAFSSLARHDLNPPNFRPALMVGGRLLPELAESAVWAATGDAAPRWTWGPPCTTSSSARPVLDQWVAAEVRAGEMPPFAAVQINQH